MHSIATELRGRGENLSETYFAVQKFRKEGTLKATAILRSVAQALGDSDHVLPEIGIELMRVIGDKLNNRIQQQMCTHTYMHTHSLRW